MKLLKKLQESQECWYLIILSFVFFLLRLPSLFEPYWYGDEGIYQAVGMSIRAGRLLYVGTWDNKPPLLYILYALFNGDQFSTKFVSALVGVLCIIAFYVLAKTLLKAKSHLYLLTLLFTLLFGLPLLEGNIANAENFMMLPILLGGYLLFTRAEKLTPKQLFSIGALLAFAFLFKVVAAFDIAAFFLFLLFLQYRSFEQLRNLIEKLLPFVLGVISLILACSVFFLLKGAFWDFFNASFRQNVGYIRYGNTFIIAQGLLLLKFLLLALFVLYLFFKRDSFSRSSLFVSLWLAFSVFNAFFAGRPYTHYLLVLLPSFLLFGALVFANLITQKKRSNLIFKVLFVILVIIILKSFNFYGKTISYYSNFLSFITQKTSQKSYQAFFDYNTPRDYELAGFLNFHMKLPDTLFIWGNNAQLYKLTSKIPIGRYTVEYHIIARSDTLAETQRVISQARPRFVVVMPVPDQFPFSLSGYFQRYNIDNATIYESLF